MALDRTKPVQTRDGHPVRIVTWTEGSKKYPIIGFIGDKSTPDSWTAEGTFLSHSFDDDYDLVNVPPKQTVTWHRFWNSGVSSTGHVSREAALSPVKERGNPAGLLKVTWEGGKPVSVELEAI